MINDLSKKQMQIVKEKIEETYQVTIIDEINFHTYLDFYIDTEEKIKEFNENNWNWIKQGILEDYSKEL